jgi:hypothetical protein
MSTLNHFYCLPCLDSATAAAEVIARSLLCEKQENTSNFPRWACDQASVSILRDGTGYVIMTREL